MFEASEVWVRRRTLVWRKLGTEAVVLDPDDRILRGFNAAGWSVWTLLDGAHTVAEVADKLAADYKLSDEQALADTRAFLKALDKAQLVEKTP